MAADNRTIVLELNELCPPLLDQYIRAGMLPNFQRLRDAATVYTTHTDDADLEPWVQWVSFHAGEAQDKHGVRELDEGKKITLPMFWDTLAEKNKRSLVFGVMNAPESNSDLVTIVPDPWSKHVKASDPEYDIFHAFVSQRVAEHANPKAENGIGPLLKFGKFLLGHGLRIKTVAQVAMHLLSEKLGGKDISWRRATILDQLSWDVFRHAYKRSQPDLAIFFANSVAFYQHRYWRHMKPEQYQVKPSQAELDVYGDAIAYGYRAMDVLVGDAMALADDNTTIVFATGISQEENLSHEATGGKYVYRPVDFDAVTAWVGADAGLTVQPVMTHQAWATYADEDGAKGFEAALAAITANGKPLFEWRREANRVLFWCAFVQKVEAGLSILNERSNESKSFAEFFAPVGMVNTSRHNRNGAFWVMHPTREHRVHTTQIPLEQASAQIVQGYS